jgi:hypothetical protein
MNRATGLKYQFPEMLATEGSTKRRLLQTVVENATWKCGVLQTELFEPFEILRHSPTWTTPRPERIKSRENTLSPDAENLLKAQS